MDEIKLIADRFDKGEKQTLSHVHVVQLGITLFTFAGMELPWKNNEHNISCIPVGIYDCEKVPSSASIPYDHISITNVPDRSGVCIHKCNFSRQLRGCLAVGDKHVDIDNDKLLDITNSGKAFSVLMRMMPDKFKLEIK